MVYMPTHLYILENGIHVRPDYIYYIENGIYDRPVILENGIYDRPVYIYYIEMVYMTDLIIYTRKWYFY